MAKKAWCIATTDPIVNQVAKKYNLTQADARTIINNARSDDAAIKDDITLELLEAQESFQKALDTYTKDYITTENMLLKDVPGDFKSARDIKESFREQFGIDMTDEEAEQLVDSRNSLPISFKTSRKNTRLVLSLLKDFSNPQRREFLGDWLCHALPEFVTRVQIDPKLRKQFKIEKQEKRIDYFIDPNVLNAFRATVIGDDRFSEEPGELEIKASNIEENKPQLAKELDMVADYLNAFFFLYGTNFFRNEGVGVTLDGVFYKTDSQHDSAERNAVDDSEEDDEDNNDGETTVTTFSASDQNKSILTKMVPDIKLLLNTLRDKTAKGQDKTDPYGYGLCTYVSSAQAVNKILRICKGCTSFGDMMSTMKANQRATPWLTQLIGILDTENKLDMTGNNTVSRSKKEQLQTMFFQSFRKQFAKFRHVYQKRDEYGNMLFVNADTNVRNQEDRILNQVQRNFRRMQGMSILHNGAIDRSVLTFMEATVGSGERRAKDLGSLGVSLNKAIAQAKRIYANATKNGEQPDYSEVEKVLNDIQEDFRSALASYGIKVSKQLLMDFAVNDPFNRSSEVVLGKGAVSDIEKTIANRYTRLLGLARMIKNLNNKLEGWLDADKDKPTVSPFSNKTVDSDRVRDIRIAYRNLASQLTEYSTESYESMARVNKKTYYSWNNPSSMLTVVEALQNGDKEKVREYIKEKYCQDTTWYLKPGSTADNPHFYSDLLEALYWGDESRNIDYSEVLSFNGDKYDDMSDLSYTLCMLSDYFSIQNFGQKNAKSHSWYRMFIAGDKPRFATVMLPRYSDRSTVSTEFGELYSETNYHTIISRKAAEFFAQELRRSENVIRYAFEHPEGLKILGYDIDASEDKYKKVFDKISEGKKITVSDVVENGKYIFSGTGAAFYLNKFINKEIEKNSPIGQLAVDRVFNSHMYTEERTLLDQNEIAVFSRAFQDYMSEMVSNNMKEYEKIGMFEQNEVQDDEGHQAIHMKYLLGNMRQWNIDNPEFAKFLYKNNERAAQLAAEKKVDFSTKNGTVYRPYFNEKAQFEQELEEFVYNNWLAKANMSEVFDVDLAFYGDTTNFQKRNAQVVSSGHTTDPDAMIHGQRVSDGYYRSVTLLTEKEPSQHLDNIEQLLNYRERQISDQNVRKQFNIVKTSVLSNLRKGIDTTDGQAFTSITGLRKRRAGQGEWSRSDDEITDERGYVEDSAGNRTYVYTDEAVYRRMKRAYAGEPEEVKTNDLMHVLAQVQKDFVYTTDNFKREGRGTITVPVQHKNSEYCLSFLTAFTAIENPNSKLAAICHFLEDSAESDPIRGIDTVNFDSAVKIGGTTSAIDIAGLTPKETLKKLRTSSYTNTRNRNPKNYREGVVTKYDAKDYKIVQEKGEHYKRHMQPTGSQFKILAINNIPDSAVIKMPDGSTITGKELRTEYFRLLKQKTMNSQREFMKELGIRKPAAIRLRRISNWIKSAMSTDHKFNVEMRQQLSIVERNGIDQFYTPLDEPGIQSAIEALVFSKIRRAHYRQKSNGGIVVQATSWGEAEDLHIRFYSDDEADNGILKTKEEYLKAHKGSSEADYAAYRENHQKGYAYFEMEAPMPEYVRKMIADRSGKIDSKYYNEDGTWNMDEIRKVVPDSVFDAICYRVPTEAKYSIMACRIVRFSKEGPGSVAKYPKELTEFTGSDFDIDTDTVELRPASETDKNAYIDNRLFDLELAALRSDAAIGETFKSGDFSDLSVDSYYYTLLEHDFTKEQLDKMNKKELKEACKEVEDLDLMDPWTDVVLHNQNADAGKMIGIAAVGVTSHAFLSLYNDVDLDNPKRDPSRHPENFFRIKVQEGDGKDKISKSFTVVNDRDSDYVTKKYIGGDVLLDMVYDMDGKLISTEVSKYVGASADAAKDAALARLGLNQRTLPVAILMHRMGISSDVIRAFMKQPAIKEILLQLSIPDESGSKRVSDACKDAILKTAVEAGIDFSVKAAREDFAQAMKDIKHDSNNTLVYSDLLKNIEDPKSQTIEDVWRIIITFQNLAELAEQLRSLDGFTRYNSSNAMKGSSFFDRFATRNRLRKLNASLSGENSMFRLPQDIEISDDYEPNEFGRLCTMYPHIAQNIIGETEMIDSVILENMHTYNSAFFGLVDRLNIRENADAMRALYDGWKNYLLFYSDKRIVDFRNNPEEAKFYTRDFAEHFSNKLAELENNEATREFAENNSFLQSIGFVHAKDGYGNFDVLNTDIVNLSGPELEKYKKDWEAMLNNPETAELAVDLAVHFLARSASFARDTPVIHIPVAVKNAIRNYTDAFRDADNIQFDKEELNKFIILFARNNASNRKLVPHLRTTENQKSARVLLDNEYHPVLRVGIEASRAMSENVITAKDENGDARYTLRMPVFHFTNQAGQTTLLLATDDEITIEKIGKDNYYLIPVDYLSPLGIPGQLSEYAGSDPKSDSIYTDEGQTSPNPDAADEQQQLEPEITESDLFDENDYLEYGSSVGSYFDILPFGTEAIDKSVRSAMAKDIVGVKSNAFLESRTQLKRATMLAPAFGARVRSTQRGLNTSASPTYFINIATGNPQTTHLQAIKMAVMLNALSSNPSFHTRIRTYVRGVADANTVHFTVKTDKVESEIKDLMQYYSLDADMEYNADSKELMLTFEFGSDTPKGKLEEMRRFVKEAQSLASEGKRALVDVNYSVSDIIDKEEQIDILNTIRDESREQEQRDDMGGSGRNDSGDAEGTRNETRRQVRVSDLASLGIANLSGENVREEISNSFNERYSPLLGVESSYRSATFAEEVWGRSQENASLRDISNEDLAQQANDLISGRRRGEPNPLEAVDNLIINAANWIIGNRSDAQLEGMLKKLGFSVEDGKSIIATIKEVIKEQDIC